jgi:hypothetical protein
MYDSQFGNNHAVHRRESFEYLIVNPDWEVTEHSPARRPKRCRKVTPKLVDARKFAYPVLSDDDWSLTTSDSGRSDKRFLEDCRARRRSPRSVMRMTTWDEENYCPDSFRVLQCCNEPIDMWIRRSQRSLLDRDRSRSTTRRASSIQLYGNDNRVVRYSQPNSGSRRPRRASVTTSKPPLTEFMQDLCF